MTTERRTRAWPLVAALAAVVVIGLLLTPFFRDFLKGQRRSTDRDRLKWVMLAIHNYHDEYGSLPPAYVAGPDGRRWHSWRAMILPQLGQSDLARKYRWDEPWDGPNNRQLAKLRPEMFASADAADESGQQANFLAVVGASTMWPEQYAIQFSDVHDGISNTVCLVNDISSKTNWLEPVDLAFDDRDSVLERPGSEGAFAGLGDGSIRFISSKIDGETWRKLLTAGSGAPFRGLDFPVADNLLNRTLPPLVDAEILNGVTISVHESVPLGHNTVIACATFPKAWSALASKLGQPIARVDGSTVGEELSRSNLLAAKVDPESFVAVAGLMSDEADVKKAKAALAGLLPGRESEGLASASPAAVFAIAALKKQMPFRHPFDVIRPPLNFEGSDSADVRAFGIEHVETRNEVSPFDSQVEVIEFKGKDDFVIVLHTAGARRDEIVLAKLPPGPTLGETWDAVQQRFASRVPKKQSRLRAGETLQVPCLALGASSRFPEITGRGISGTQYVITRAHQDLQFLLDEKGAWVWLLQR